MSTRGGVHTRRVYLHSCHSQLFQSSPAFLFMWCLALGAEILCPFVLSLSKHERSTDSLCDLVSYAVALRQAQGERLWRLDQSN